MFKRRFDLFCCHRGVHDAPWGNGRLNGIFLPGGFNMHKFIIATVIAAASVGSVYAAEPIVGTWKRSNGTMIKYAASGGQFCGTVLNGEYKGHSIGCMSGKGAKYKGKVNKLDEGKTYTGKASVKGNTLKLSGCALAGLICKSENLKRQ
jgi:uncharacterized protein (DUF2147 family)